MISARTRLVSAVLTPRLASGSIPATASPSTVAACSGLTIYVDRCTGPTLDEIAKHATRWTKGLDFQGKQLHVILSVGGLERPRCEPDDPRCLPVPYDDDVSVRRTLGSVIQEPLRDCVRCNV